VGDFLAALINFLIIGFVAWRISKIFLKPEAETPMKDCPYCRMSINAAATRCPNCTSQLAPA
jgi:large conductance mechanosensitive channel